MSLLLLPVAPSIPKLNLLAILDILFVAFLIYQLLMIVRGTRAGHILIGILTMVMIYGLAVWAGLEALRSLLSYIVPYTAIAVIPHTLAVTTLGARVSGARVNLEVDLIAKYVERLLVSDRSPT